MMFNNNNNNNNTAAGDRDSSSSSSDSSMATNHDATTTTTTMTTMMMETDGGGEPVAGLKRVRPLSPTAEAAEAVPPRLSLYDYKEIMATAPPTSVLDFPFELSARAVYPLLPSSSSSTLLLVAEQEEEETVEREVPYLAAARISHRVGLQKPDEEVDYVLLLDKSGSMRGQREANLVAGVNALVHLLLKAAEGDNNEERLTLIAFDTDAAVIVPPSSAQATLDQMPLIRTQLHASGGTSIARALELAMEVADAKLGRGRPVVVLLLTDGDDPSLASALAEFQRRSEDERRALLVPGGDRDTFYDQALLARLGRRSGLQMHFVGICADADAQLLGGLSELAFGTYVCIRDDDIKVLLLLLWALLLAYDDVPTSSDAHTQGLMGSLIGLVMDKFSHAAILSVDHQQASAGGAPSSFAYPALLAPRLVHIRAGLPTVVPFVLPRAAAPLELRLRLVLLPIGATIDLLSVGGAGAFLREIVADVALPRATTPEAFALARGHAEWSIVTQHALAWYGEASEAIARALALGQDARRAVAVLQPFIARVQALVALAPEAHQQEVAGLRTLLDEAIAERGRLEDAAHDFVAAREASARSASHASTVRNGGISIGDMRIESERQASMRTASLSF